MDDFTLRGDYDFLKITFQEVFGFPDVHSYFGGYDAKSTIEIFTDGFTVQNTFWLSTGEIFDLYESLSKANNLLKGIVYFRSSEGNLEFNIKYDVNGHVSIMGEYTSQNEYHNLLKFHIPSDQSHIQSGLVQLKRITAKYGGNERNKG